MYVESIKDTAKVTRYCMCIMYQSPIEHYMMPLCVFGWPMVPMTTEVWLNEVEQIMGQHQCGRDRTIKATVLK